MYPSFPPLVFKGDAVRPSMPKLFATKVVLCAEVFSQFHATQEFCFEGSCCHCEMEVDGGAVEVQYTSWLSIHVPD